MRLKREFLRYVAVSLLALSIDTILLLALAKVTHYLIAACIAFLVGSVVHYILSVRLVFETRRLQHRVHAERIIFIAAGFLGLLVNASLIYISIEMLRLPLLPAKLIAAGGSFATGYLSRKITLFS